VLHPHQDRAQRDRTCMQRASGPRTCPGSPITSTGRARCSPTDSGSTSSSARSPRPPEPTRATAFTPGDPSTGFGPKPRRSSRTGSGDTCTPAARASSTWSTTEAPRHSAHSRERSRVTRGWRRGGPRNGTSRGSRTSSLSFRRGARGGGRLGASTRDRAPPRPPLARDVVTAVRGERGSARRPRRPRLRVEAPAYRRRSPPPRELAGPAARPPPSYPVPRPVLHRCRPRPSASHLPRIDHAPIPRPAAPTCPLTPRRGDAPRDGGHSLRRQAGVGKASTNDRHAGGLASPRTTLARPGADGTRPPEPGALRPLARALVDLASALQDDEEDERWTR
jgi:hypothetical protein